MDVVRRRAGWLLGLGLLGGLVWATAVTLSMPGWYDPDRDCGKKFLTEDNLTTVRSGWFPPSASCVYGDTVRQYMSTTRSVVLSIIGVLLLAVIAVSLVLVVRRLTGDPGPVRTADDINLRRRRRTHLIFGAIDMALVFAVVTFVNVAAIAFGELPGAILFIVLTLVGISAFGAALDNHMGPLPSTALESRRRGTVAGLATYGVVFAATAFAGQLPFFRFWAAPAAGVAYAVIVGVQWSRATRPNPTQAQAVSRVEL
ncbi:hypothetical protein [Kribbella solani]|uniref:hypothetical protein n=1 Tax=Kribbella solani TaxID=236067 RepID=UPI0029BCDA61|nr:hypothetical protein [Kribbella solani]MDX2971426.1 hypothetical protein [Kribbella solani]